jgi:hypothetical protein
MMETATTSEMAGSDGNPEPTVAVWQVNPVNANVSSDNCGG